MLKKLYKDIKARLITFKAQIMVKLKAGSALIKAELVIYKRQLAESKRRLKDWLQSWTA